MITLMSAFKPSGPSGRSLSRFHNFKYREYYLCLASMQFQSPLPTKENNSLYVQSRSVDSTDTCETC